MGHSQRWPPSYRWVSHCSVHEMMPSEIPATGQLLIIGFYHPSPCLENEMVLSLGLYFVRTNWGCSEESYLDHHGLFFSAILRNQYNYILAWAIHVNCANWHPLQRNQDREWNIPCSEDETINWCFWKTSVNDTSISLASHVTCMQASKEGPSDRSRGVQVGPRN